MQHVRFIFKGICALVLALALTGLMYAHFNRNGLSQKVLKALRQELTTELKIAYFDVDLFSAFPRIRLDLHDVELGGKGGTDLLTAKRLQLTLSLFSLFSDEIQCAKISLKDGAINIERLEDGSLSLQVLQAAEEQKNGGSVIHFNKVMLENMRLHYNDTRADQEYQVRFEHAAVQGTYGYHQLEFQVGGDLIYDKARIESASFLNEVSGKIKATIALDFEDQLYTFRDVALEMGKQQFSLQGSVRGADDYQYTDIEVTQGKGELVSFLSMLPESYRKSLPFNLTQGTFDAKGVIRGRINANENPHVHFDIEIEDSKVQSLHEKGVLSNVTIKGAFDNGAFRRLQSASMDLPLITGSANGQRFEAALKYADFIDPTLQCSFTGTLPAEFVLDYTGFEKIITKACGSVHFADVDIGSLRLGTADLTDVQFMKGRCTLENIELQTAGTTYRIGSGRLSLDKDTLQVADLHVARGQDDLLINGWAAELGDALESGDPAFLQYRMDLKAGSVDISKWIPALASNGSELEEPHVRSVSLTTTAPIRLPVGEFVLTARQFQFQQILADAVEASVSTGVHHAIVDVRAKVADGDVNAFGEFEIQNGYRLHFRMQGDSMNIHECFRQCNNFGQNAIRTEHIKGRADLRIVGDIPWDAEGVLNKNNIHVLAGMSVRNGELINFNMLEQFSNYVHVEDLRRIKFARIDNFIEVRKGNVYIPTMFIQSNAVNLAVNGVHTLDNRILYNIKVNAGQVLSAKMKKHNPRLLPQPARKEGTFNLYFTLTGTMESFTYDMNKRAVESSFAQSAELREHIRDQLRTAFGELVDLIEPPEWETIPEYDLEQKGEEIFLEIGD